MPNLVIRANSAAGIFESDAGSGVVGMSMQWTDLPLKTTTFRKADFSSASNAYTPFRSPGASGGNTIWHSSGGLSNGPYWETQPKDPAPGGDFGSHETTVSYKCWGDSNMPADSAQLYVAAITMEITEGLLETWASQNGGGKMFYQMLWNTAGTAADTNTEICVFVQNGDQDQSNDTNGSFFALANAGAGGSYQRDGVHTPLNLTARPGERVVIIFVHDFRPSSGSSRGGHIFYKYEGDSVVSKALYRGYNIDYRGAGTYAQVDTGRGFAQGAAGGFVGNFWGYLDNLDGMAGTAEEAFYVYDIESGNGRFALPW